MLFQDEWFALQVKTRAENQVATMLRAKGYEEFLPTHNVKKKGISSQAPFFPGYVFCKVNTHACGLIVTTPGVIRIVEFGGKPAAIDPEEIRSLQLIVNSGVPVCVMKGLNVGDKIRIEAGPLQGAVGILLSMKPKQRLLVSISMMMRTVIAEVDPEWVSAVNSMPLHKPPLSASQPHALAYSA